MAGVLYAKVAGAWVPIIGGASGTSGGNQLGYTQVTTNSGTYSNVESGIGLSFSFTSDGARRVRLCAQVQIQSTVAGDLHQLRIKEGSTILQANQYRTGGVSQMELCRVELIYTPTAGSHTMVLAAIRVGGTGTLNTVASATTINWFMAEDLGPA